MNQASQMPLRLPSSLHEALKKAAALEGVSLNQYCLYVLSQAAISREEWSRSRGEDLMKFLEEASLLQKELNNSRKHLSTPEAPKETPLRRYHKLYGKH